MIRSYRSSRLGEDDLPQVPSSILLFRGVNYHHRHRAPIGFLYDAFLMLDCHYRVVFINARPGELQSCSLSLAELRKEYSWKLTRQLIHIVGAELPLDPGAFKFRNVLYMAFVKGHMARD